MTESTTIVAFDQHANSVVAGVLGAGDQTPALHPLSGDLPTLGRFVARLQRRGPVQCCYEAGPLGLELASSRARQLPTDHGHAVSNPRISE